MVVHLRVYGFYKGGDYIEDEKVLQYAIEHGIIDMQSIQQGIEMDRRKKIIASHKYKLRYNEKKGRWYTLFDVDGDFVQRSRKTKEELEDLIVTFYENDGHFEPYVEPYTFSQAHDRWYEVQISYGKNPNTLYKYEHDWRRYFCGTKFSKRDITEISPIDIEVFMIDTIKKLNLRRNQGVDLYGYITGVYYTAVRDKKVDKNENPCDLVDKKRFARFYNREKKPSRTMVLSPQEVKALIGKMNVDVTERPTCLSPYGVRLSLLTGMRTGEICGLRWSNVYEDYIDICESEKFNQLTKEYYVSDTKTSKSRTFPITEGLRSFLNSMKKLQEQYGITDDFVISTDAGKLHTRCLSDYMIKSSKKLGFEVTKGIHSIRRTFNSYMRNSGVSATIAGSIIGNTAEVNDGHYTYDICDQDTKCKLVTSVENQMISEHKFA